MEHEKDFIKVYYVVNVEEVREIRIYVSYEMCYNDSHQQMIPGISFYIMKHVIMIHTKNYTWY